MTHINKERNETSQPRCHSIKMYASTSNHSLEMLQNNININVISVIRFNEAKVNKHLLQKYTHYCWALLPLITY